MATTFIMHSGSKEDVADRVLRRAQVSKVCNAPQPDRTKSDFVTQMTRALQDRLALANIKIQGHGWQNKSIGSIDAELGRELKRKRSEQTTTEPFSDSASSVSGSVFSSSQPLSSPLEAPIFSDEISPQLGSQNPSKRYRPITTAAPSANTYIHPSQTQHRHKPRQSTRPARGTWKSSYHLAESSPIRPKPRPSLNYDYPSHASETSTVLDSPCASEDDDQDLPLHSFRVQQQSLRDASHIPSSPPRTPSPAPARSAKLSSFSPLERYNAGGKEGADLLLYLASSPSPAMNVNPRSPPSMLPPTTPPMKQTPLPSSAMTPGTHALFNFGTPNTAFNFADYCNVTPSPAQKRWGNTPKIRTPATASFRSSRREGGSIVTGMMGPPATITSPNMVRTSVIKGHDGLGMEFGGQLLK